MKHQIIEMRIGVVPPVEGPSVLPADQQVGRQEYKGGTVGKKFVCAVSIPVIDMNNFVITNSTKPDTEVSFLTDNNIAFYENLVAKGSDPNIGWAKINNGNPAYVNKENFDVKVPPFYWIETDGPNKGNRRMDKNGNLSPIRDTVRIISSIADGKPVKDVNAEALRLVSQFGHFVDVVDNNQDDPFQPTMTPEAAVQHITGTTTVPNPLQQQAGVQFQQGAPAQ